MQAIVNTVPKKEKSPSKLMMEVMNPTRFICGVSVVME
jgi:hypothetical protein